MNIFIQLELRQLLSVHTVVHHGQLAQPQVVADAKLPAKVSDVLDFLTSKLLLTKRVAFDIFLLLQAIDKDENKFALSVLAKNESEIDIRGVPISDTEARLPTKSVKSMLDHPWQRYTYGSPYTLSM